MRTLFILIAIAMMAGCSSKQDEEFTPYPGGEFTPYPGGKCCEQNPKT